jgi:hypothetical protein
MHRRRRTVKLDANHTQVCTEARQQGIDVVELLQPLDTVCHLAGYVSFVEIKGDKSTHFTRPQLKFMSETRFPVVIVRTASELVEAMRTRICLSKMQKDALAGFLAVNKADKWNGEQVTRLLNS